MRLLVPALMCSALSGEGAFSALSIEQALAEAGKNHCVVLIDFYTTWCGPCKLLDSTTWKDGKIIALLKQNAISLKIDAEKETALSKKFAINAYPTLLLLNPDGTVLDRMVGYQKPDAFLVSFQSALKGTTSLDRARTAVSEASKGDLKSQVMARWKLAQTLVEQGQNGEALKEYLWLYDDGMKRNQGSGGTRNSFLLLELQRLSQNYPPALEALRQHRDIARTRFLASPDDRSAAQDLTALNHALKEDQASIDTFDQLTPDSPGRKLIGPAIWDELIARRRYADAMQAQSPNDILEKIARQEGFLPEDQALQKIIKARWLALTASGIEALVGTGRLDEARGLVKKALSIDSSPEAYLMLDKHIKRSGQAVLLDSLR
jgi:thioredoxin 1